MTSTINQQMHLYNFHLQHFNPYPAKVENMVIC